MEFKILNDLNEDIINIRTEAFVNGRNVPKEVDFDGKDPHLLHFCIYDENKLIAYLRAEANGKLIHAGRVVVDESFRKRGYGRMVMNFLCDYARDNNFSAVELSAIDTAKGFYEKLGFKSEGDFYLETGVPHIYMKKEL